MEKTCESKNAFGTWERGRGGLRAIASQKSESKRKKKSPAHVRGGTMSLQETHQCLLLTINMSRSGVLTARRRRWHRGSSAFSDNLHPDDPGMPRPEPHRVECRLSFSSFNIPSFLFLYSFFFLRGPCVDHNERTGLVASDRMGKRHSFR